MKLVADENVERQIVHRLRDDGHTVAYIAELDPGIGDPPVLETAREHSSVLITSDKDFGELVYRQGLTHCGVIFLRLEGLSNDDKADLVASVIRQHEKELLGAFCVVTKTTVRIRKSSIAT